MRLSIPCVTAVALSALALIGCQREDQPQGPSVEIAQTAQPPAATSQSAPNIQKEESRETRTIRVAYVRSLGSLPAYAAKQKNSFEKPGIDTQFIDTPMDSKPCLDLLRSGDADVAFGVNLEALLEADAAAPGIHGILGYAAETQENPFGAFLVPKSSPLASLDDLRGKNVAAAGDECAGRLAAMLLTPEGEAPPDIPVLSADDLAAFDFQAPDAPDALYVTGGAMATLTKGMPAERTTKTIAQAALAAQFNSPFPIQAIVLRKSLASENPGGLAAFAEATDSLLEWCNQNCAEVLPSLQTEFTLDDESTLNLIVPLFVKRGRIAAPDLARAEALWTGAEASQGGVSRLAPMELSHQ